MVRLHEQASISGCFKQFPAFHFQIFITVVSLYPISGSTIDKLSNTHFSAKVVESQLKTITMYMTTPEQL